MASDLVKLHLARQKTLQAIKDPWNVHYQSLAEIFLTRKQNFLGNITPGEFLQEDVFDNSGQFAAFLMGSTFLSMLWPDASRT